MTLPIPIGYWIPQYWAFNYWDINYWARTTISSSLLTPGYWHSNYWAKGYWIADYWAEYGVVEVEVPGGMTRRYLVKKEVVELLKVLITSRAKLGITNISSISDASISHVFSDQSYILLPQLLSELGISRVYAPHIEPAELGMMMAQSVSRFKVSELDELLLLGLGDIEGRNEEEYLLGVGGWQG